MRLRALPHAEAPSFAVLSMAKNRTPLRVRVPAGTSGYVPAKDPQLGSVRFCSSESQRYDRLLIDVSFRTANITVPKYQQHNLCLGLPDMR